MKKIFMISHRENFEKQVKIKDLIKIIDLLQVFAFGNAV